MKPLIHMHELRCGHNGRTLVEIPSLGIVAGELVALTGRNGTGKSTLLLTLAGLLAPVSGQVLLSGSDLSLLSPGERARRISLVHTRRTEIGVLDVRTVVAMGRYPHRGRWTWTDKADAAHAERALDAVGMASFAHQAIGALSDGERQKVMIARALCQEAPAMLLDEPTAFLDYVAREEVLVLLERLARERGIAILFSTHDLELAGRFASSRWMVADGRISVTRADA